MSLLHRSFNRICRFYAIYFPAMVMALDMPLPERLLVHFPWTVEKKKTSKSVGNVVNVGMSRPITRRNTTLTSGRRARILFQAPTLEACLLVRV